MHEHRATLPRRAVGVLALAVALVAGAPAAPAVAGRPAGWDTRLVPLVRDVERLRGLEFEHPVAVRFLTESAFEEKVAIDRGDLTDADERQLERSEATLRAVGLVGGDVDLVAALSDLQVSGVLAYYEPASGRITVRGTTLDVPTRVTLAHELTHALQDQHFDLVRFRRRASRADASSAARALIEGDARRVENAYVRTLSDPEREEYARWQRDTSDRVTGAIAERGVPNALVVLFQSPYALGPEMLRVLVAGRDDAAVDELFGGEPLSDLSYLDPRTLLTGHAARAVPAPELGPGEQRVGESADVLGAFALHLLLATAGDPVESLRVADGWGGDSLVTFTRDGTTCMRVNVVGADRSASAAIGDALGAWASTRTDGSATVTTDGDVTTLTACDRGVATTDPGRAPQAALVTVVMRNTLMAQGAEQVGVDAGSCIADRSLGDASFAPLLEATVADPAVPVPDAVAERFTRAAGAALLECRRR